jgi:ABC-type branched-subunit amino acid transport system ATPase component/branched-subunit amino acid ABC-type transport system permease component
MLIYVVAGLTTGSIFGLAAVGVVLTYKTSGIFNFAHGALASAAAFIFYFLYTQHGLPWPIAAAVSIVVCGPILGLGLEFIARRLAPASLPMRVLGTVGILLAIEGLLELVYPPGPDREVSQFLPISGFSIVGTPIGYYRVIIFAIGLAAVVGLTAFLRWTRAGLSMRAVVDNTELLDVSGTSPSRIRRYAWLIGSTTAAVSGVLIAPLLPLNATSLTLLVVTAFGAAAMGAFNSLPLTYLGGLAIGIAQSLLNEYVQNSTGLLGGLSSSLPFLLLFVLLLVAPRLRRPSGSPRRLAIAAPSWRVPSRLRVGGLAGLVAALCLAPLFAGIYITAWTEMLAYAIVFLSLGLLVRAAGQVSLAQVSFMAIGVVAFSHLAADHHWPWLLALLAAGVIAAPIGALLAIPAIRFPGLYLALATLGFGIMLQQMFYSQSYMFGAFNAGIAVPTPYLPALGLDGGDDGYYYLVLLITIIVAGLVLAVTHTRLGRLLRAMGDSPTGLASTGVSINLSRVLVFALSASIAAIGGALDGGVLGSVTGSTYQPLNSLQLYAVVILTVGGIPWYAVMAAAGSFLLPEYISSSATVSYVFTLIFGVSAIGFAIRPDSGLALHGRVRSLVDRALGFTRRPSRAAPRQAGHDHRGAEPSPPPLTNIPSAGLAIDGVTVRFGGLVAAEDVTLYAAPGLITGLIGPNGAGKTTLFNVCTGLVKPTQGRIRLGDHAIGRTGASDRARKGLGRTFQHLELFDSLSVRANVALGAEGRFAGRYPLGHLIATRRQRAEVERRTQDALDQCGISGLADETVGTLSTGQRRLVEFARCLAGRFSVLLLDEPSSGLDRQETAMFGEILRSVVARRGVAILLIEHDMALVHNVCDRIYVLDSGRNLFEGTSEEVTAAPEVRSAYLGPAGPATAGRTRAPVPEPADTASPVLRLEAVDAGYGLTKVLRHVDVDVHAGQVVALLGPNGAGKTTLLRTAGGILRPASGRVLLDGVDVSALPPHRRAKMGLCLIPEGRGVFRSLSVLENLRLQLPAGRQRPTPAALGRAFDAFPVLAARRHELAGRLSGGQQQMLALARAYLSDPKVIMLDELSMGLAPLVVDEIFATVEQLKSAGVAVLLVEQYVTRAIAISDKVVLLDKGEVSYHGAASAVDEATLVQGYLGMQDQPTWVTLP